MVLPAGEMSLQRKSFQAYGVKASDTEEGVVEAIVAVFNNVDHAKERIRPGAFTKSLARKAPKGVWCHNWERPVAKTLEAKELLAGDAQLPEVIRHLGGLYIKAQFALATDDGRNAYEHLKFGTIDEFSIGYLVISDDRKSEPGIRDLLENELFEWSPVLSGMNPATQLIAVKSRAQQLFTERKAQYLGEYAEASMTMAALRELTDRLHWYCLYDAIYEDQVPLADRRAMLELALDEYRTLMLRTYDALMADATSDALQLAAKTIRELWPEPGKTAAPPATPPAPEAATKTQDLARQALAMFQQFEARRCGVPV